ncbi:XRE family transcriptional regulator [Aetokthonos hydrillicola Thurmond2011]|uniref:XRE family transcriptional regulator n=1 Tax=Aetokthonos hydrillicola Thurmond2011 TaxID=2712845 RepID=A0AAP5IG96_9CYAN|nr:XRE family transcriptional regulator [Aetokthonos hydrillicola]MBO3463862.1 XRE family transcriptional regulator [Aetokthonos hydrillicola CCALA 1050]MBW4589782.1 XRE family transcriptional regulator [Aetokthonos hydrillicola CCALA 1050]MDR9900277.1 XRE family transcriptional regulator [Aetokthonos hydrillicola Thurmond2011]
MKVNNFSQAFDKTLKHYGITGKALSNQSGVSQNHISEFRRNAGNISLQTLSSLMMAMDELAPGSSDYFLSQLCHQQQNGSVSLENKLERMIEAATDEEVEGAMLAIARRWRLKSGNNGHGNQVLSA